MSVPDPHPALREHFGFTAFRPGQEEAVRAALAGRDVLVVMPTGAGKSLCYQLPALMRADLTLVVSPLVSLMQDQVEALERRAPGQVALVTGQRSAAENDRAVAAAVRGDVRVLYVAPERFSSPGFARALEPARVGLFVVDEAHCVSQWGHDFRPDYFRLGDAARFLGAEAIVASTATATPQVAADVVARLGLREPVRVATGFDRPNLTWAVVPTPPQERDRRLVAELSRAGATPAIVYAGTRREVDRLAVALEGALDRPVLAYHAGLERRERAAAQERFMRGDADVVVATNAFGMGVDKADVRTVVHATVPPSVEAYYQEAGRAGRDGAPARAVLLAAERDKGLHVHFIERASVTEEAVARVAEVLERAAGGPPVLALPGFDAAPPPWFDVALADLAGAEGADQVRAIVGALSRVGVVQPAPSTVDRIRGRLLTGFDAAARRACAAIAEDARRARWAQYRAIWGWVEGRRCRRAALLRALRRPDRRGAATRVLRRLRRPVRSARSGAQPVSARTSIRAVLAAAPELELPLLVAVLRGERSAAIAAGHLDGLPGYGTLAHLGRAQLQAEVAALVERGSVAA